MRQDHPLAEAFRIAWRAAQPTICPHGHAPRLKAYFLNGFGLVVSVSEIDAGWLEPSFLHQGPKVGYGLLNAGGEAMWGKIHALALVVLDAHAAPYPICAAIVLDPTVWDEWAEGKARTGRAA